MSEIDSEENSDSFLDESSKSENEQVDTKSLHFVWDFTLYNDEIEFEAIIKVFKTVSKKWCFQREKCPKTGKLHWQGRINLNERVRFNGARNVFMGNELGTPHLTITSNKNKTNMFYVMKPETRVDGPWNEKWVPVYIPKQYRQTENELWSFQKSVLDSCRTEAGREINVIIDTCGNKGKSHIIDWMECRGLCIKLDALSKDPEKIMQEAYSQVKNEGTVICVDFPRAANQDHVGYYYATLEVMKSGRFNDKRYGDRPVKRVDTPVMWIMCNVKPDVNLLTPDRWKLWKIQNKELVVY